MVKISVIIPIYNDEKYLKECLDSIIAQTFTDIEILCINDGSSDNTADILEEYGKKDSRIKIFTQTHKGTSSARNVGMNSACGDYIYFADSDDYLDRNTLETIYSISTQKDLDVLIFKLASFDNYTGERNYNYSDMPFLAKFEDTVFSHEDILEHLLKIDVTLYTKLFKREVLSDVRFEEGLIFEDNLFFIKYIFNCNRISFYDECLYNKRIHNHSIISLASKDYVDIITIFNMINDVFRQKGYYDMFKEKLFIRKIDAIYYRFEMINAKYKEYFFSEIKKDYMQKQTEYERELDFKMIDERSKAIFKSVIDSDSSHDFEMRLKINTMRNSLNRLKKENKKLKRENKALKDFKRSILNSNSMKITKPLRTLRNLKIRGK